MAILSRLAHAWNVFRDKEENPQTIYTGEAVTYGRRPDQNRLRFTNERSIIASIYTRIGIDAAAIEMRHVRLDDQDRYLSDINSGLNDCLTVSANIDQAGTAFRQDAVMTLLDKGCIAIVPVDTTLNPNVTGGYDIQTLRVGEICGWSPGKVRVSLYDERDGQRKEIELDKGFVAVVENPLYNVMNEPNSTLQRLIRKLNLLDVVDDQTSSGSWILSFSCHTRLSLKLVVSRQSNAGKTSSSNSKVVSTELHILTEPRRLPSLTELLKTIFSHRLSIWSSFYILSLV